MEGRDGGGKKEGKEVKGERERGRGGGSKMTCEDPSGGARARVADGRMRMS